MTSRLYYRDSYLTQFDGRITEIADGGRRVYLDRSAFYPTSGGQPFDLGTLAGRAVTDVVDEEERIAHVLDAPLTSGVGDVVLGAVDLASPLRPHAAAHGTASPHGRVCRALRL